MLKSVVLYVLLWHEMSEFASRAHPCSTDTRIPNFPARVLPKINDTDVQIEPRVIYNINTYFIFNTSQIFYMNGSSVGTTAPTTASTAAPKKTSTTNPGPGYVVTAGIGAHKLHTELLTWNQARQICIAEGGDLVVIKSDAEEEIVYRLAMTLNNYIHWVGFFKRNNEWLSVFNEPLAENGWSHWYQHKSNDPPNICAGYDTGRYKGLDSFECENRRPFICKITTI